MEVRHYLVVACIRLRMAVARNTSVAVVAFVAVAFRILAYGRAFEARRRESR